jgi:hypothetical protein
LSPFLRLCRLHFVTFCFHSINRNIIVFQVGFEGIATKGYTGDIAIDDIQLNMDCPCVCNAQNSGETPSTTRTTNMVDMATTVMMNAPTTSTITPVETTTTASTQTSGTTASRTLYKCALIRLAPSM